MGDDSSDVRNEWDSSTSTESTQYNSIANYAIKLKYGFTRIGDEYHQTYKQVIVKIRLYSEDKRLIADVEDNGKGFKTVTGKNYIRFRSM